MKEVKKNKSNLLILELGINNKKINALKLISEKLISWKNTQ